MTVVHPPASPTTQLHRVEHALLATALTALLVWTVFVMAYTDIWRVLAWAIAPDLVFIPIALASRKGRWPAWGIGLYNAAHTYASMLPAWAAASFASGHVIWPMLAWAAHIEADRALGFDLRRSP